MYFASYHYCQINEEIIKRVVEMFKIGRGSIPLTLIGILKLIKLHKVYLCFLA